MEERPTELNKKIIIEYGGKRYEILPDAEYGELASVSNNKLFIDIPLEDVIAAVSLKPITK